MQQDNRTTNECKADRSTLTTAGHKLQKRRISVVTRRAAGALYHVLFVKSRGTSSVDKCCQQPQPCNTEQLDSVALCKPLSFLFVSSPDYWRICEQTANLISTGDLSFENFYHSATHSSCRSVIPAL